MRSAARLRIWPPTVMPIWASSPAACTAVVTISVPLGRPSLRRGGGGGGAGRWAAAALGWVAAAGAFFGDRLTADLTACGLAVALRFEAFPADGFAFLADGFVAAGFAAAGFASGVVAAAGFAAAGFASGVVAAAGFAAAGFASGVVAAGFAAAAFASGVVAAAGFAAAAFASGVRAAVPARGPGPPDRRSPPILVGRVARRLPSTLGSAPLLDFLLFFLAVFWLMASGGEREFPDPALSRGTVNGRVGRDPL